MSKIKPYKEQEPSRQVVKEPVMTSYQPAALMDDFVSGIPRDALAEAIRFTFDENRTGRCIPDSQIEGLINERMGWK